MLSDLAKVIKVLRPWVWLPSSKLYLVSRLGGDLARGSGQGVPMERNLSVPIRISITEHFKSESKKKEYLTLLIPFLSWWKGKCVLQTQLTRFWQEEPFTIWVTNGIANSSCDLLCSLIISWLKESHRPFQTLTYFPCLMLLRGQRRVAFPLCYGWENGGLGRLCFLSRSPHKHMCCPIHCSQLQTLLKTTQGNLTGMFSMLA